MDISHFPYKLCPFPGNPQKGTPKDEGTSKTAWDAAQNWKWEPEKHTHIFLSSSSIHNKRLQVASQIYSQ